MKRLILAAAIAAAISTPAIAQDRGFYAGGHLGQATIDKFCDDTAGTGISCDDKDTSWKILGGYQVNRNFAVELGYIDFGKVQASVAGIGSVSAEANAFDLVAIGILPVADRFSVYGKLGAYRSTTDGKVRTIFGNDDLSEDTTDLTFGLGASFDITRQFSVRGEWQRYNDVGGGDIGESDIDVISAGVLFRF